jgi:hypothetical protein
MSTTFAIKGTRQIQGRKYEVTIELINSASSPGATLRVEVFCSDLAQIDAEVRKKLLEFAEELREAATS